MSASSEQEREFIVDLERRGVTQVRSDIDHGRIPSAFVFVAANWLSEKERESERKREAFQSEQADTASRAAVAAERAASEAARASTAAERQAVAAERANKRATIALVIATISMIATTVVAVVGIVITHWDAAK